MATIFSTLFGDVEPESYSSLSLSLETLFDAMMANYSYTLNPNYVISFSILMVLHVFISSIFLINFLVAILSTVYTTMIIGGEYTYKRDKYSYIEKYSIAM
jgi:ABC-type thiamin/hydroxymethylpyrimidine transport system permease subunit